MQLFLNETVFPSRQYLSEQAEQIDEGTGVSEERIIGKQALGNFVGPLAHQFFEFAGIVQRYGEKLPDEEKVKELFFDF